MAEACSLPLPLLLLLLLLLLPSLLPCSQPFLTLARKLMGGGRGSFPGLVFAGKYLSVRCKKRVFALRIAL